MNNSRIQTNLQNIILSNSNELLSELYHSPEMYKILIEENIRTRPSAEQLLPALFECALGDENFIKRNYHLLIKENISKHEESLIVADLKESKWHLLGQLLKQGWNWIKEGGKWVFKKLTGETIGKYPGKGVLDQFQKGVRGEGPRGKWTWNKEDPRPVWPGKYPPFPPKGEKPGPWEPLPGLGDAPTLPTPWQPPNPLEWNFPADIPGIGGGGMFEEKQNRQK